MCLIYVLHTTEMSLCDPSLSVDSGTSVELTLSAAERFLAGSLCSNG